MHIAPGITLRGRISGDPHKITAVHAEGVVRILNEERKTEGNYTPEDVRRAFEEFGPTYERVIHRDDESPLTDEVTLTRCPFCASTNLDAAAWLGNDGKHGPGCMDCGCTAVSVELWNARAATPEAVELLRIWQTWLGTSRGSCNAGDKKLWDRIETICGGT